ncbi:imidazole glycerol phosphate synthase subunit HisH [Microbulbifer sp. TYP-18]|uniref:imidazole glycerol phosphate synthase subunit HisH n=1 Tax=Microbulbifer sp. TYP-18 TaxID=3230024 RepID=UPI0034C6005F
MQRIAVLDYGMGNLHSVVSAVKRVAPEDEVVLAGGPDQAAGADRLLVPGVGSIGACMTGFRQAGFEPLLRSAIEAELPVLGICVGMQIMMRHSEENNGVDCLGIFPQPVKFFGTGLSSEGARLKVPHMGWNRVRQVVDHPLWQGIDDQSRFYFVHSYYVPAGGNSAMVGQADYGIQLAAAAARGSLFTTQFHPEKSAGVGLQLLKNFVHWDGAV